MNHDKFTGWRKSRHSNSGASCVEVATATTWHKSTHSNSSGGCVEVAAANLTVGVRDSKQHGHGPVLEFNPTAWKAFLAAVKDGQFDL